MSQVTNKNFGFSKEELLNGALDTPEGRYDGKEYFYDGSNFGKWMRCDTSSLRIDGCYSTIFADVLMSYQYECMRPKTTHQGVVSFCAAGISSYFTGKNSAKHIRNGIYVNIPRFCDIAWRWYMESSRDARGDAEVLRLRDKLLASCIREKEEEA